MNWYKQMMLEFNKVGLDVVLKKVPKEKRCNSRELNELNQRIASMIIDNNISNYSRYN